MHFKLAEKLSKHGVKISGKWIHLAHSPGQRKNKSTQTQNILTFTKKYTQNTILK